MRKPWIRYQYEEGHIPDGYTETGVDTGAKIDESVIFSKDMDRIFRATRDLHLDKAIQWLNEHRIEFEDNTLIVDTDDGRSLKPYKILDPEVIVNIRSLNTIRHLNTFLNCANEVLVHNGYILLHARTAVLKKQLIIQKYPKGINYLVFAAHYFWHRFCPKMPGLKKLYFGITKGTNRTYNRVEILGRLCRSGFEIIDEGFRFGEFIVLARKAKAPIWDDEPSCGPLIKLRRVGKDGKIFGVYKFRTMYSYSEYLQPYIYAREGLQTGGKFKDDYRVNGWGKFMRAIWLDELPMLLNFFKGELKLVGVRPLSKHYFSLYSSEMQALRIQVKPGLIPPFYYERDTPKTIENVQDSERRYIEAYLLAPLRTDWRYFWGSVYNIIFNRKKSH